METEVRSFALDKGFVRVQKVSLDSFDQLMMLKPSFNEEAYRRLVALYNHFIIKKYGSFFGQVILFHLPDGIDVPFSFEDENYGTVYDPLISVSIAFEKGIRVSHQKLVFGNAAVKDFFEMLESKGCLHIAKGKRNSVSFMPIGRSFGFLSGTKKDASFRVNSSFFIMDVFDRKSVYDTIGTPIGLNLKDGKILLPPLFDREALMVTYDDNVFVRPLSLKEIRVVVDGEIYEHGKNALFCCRPERKYTKKGGTDLALIEDRIVAVKKGGRALIPSGGFVLHIEKENFEVKNLQVRYEGLENYKFAIQAGNSAMIDGKMTDRFLSPFYHLTMPWVPAYPPSMYPLNFRKDRAPRIVLGADDLNRPSILWFEGAAKHGYDPKKDSSGVSLYEAGKICEELGLKNAVHLDGGGSAQILVCGKRSLKISDRDPVSYEEAERPVAMGLYCK